MHRFSRADLLGSLDFLGAVSDVPNVDEFALRLVTCMRTLIPCDFASYNEVDPVHPPPLFLTDPSEMVFAQTPELFTEHIDEHPLVQHYARTGTGGALRLSDFLGLRAFRRTGLYAEVFRPSGTDRILSLSFEARPGAPIIALALQRGGRDFSDRDLRLLEYLRPHLARAYQAAEERELLAQLAGVLTEERQVIVLGANATARHMSDGARELLARHLAHDIREDAGSSLPAVLLDAVARAAPSGTAVVGRNGSGLHVTVLAQSAARTTILLEASRGQDLVLALSPRESQVLRLVASGMSNRQIARTLRIRPSTVKTHLQHACEKLGVRTRAAAVAAVAAVDATCLVAAR